MKNREVKKMFMRKVKKTTVALLIAANVMSMGMPAFADDHNAVVVEQEAPAPAPEVQTPEAPVQQEAPAPEVQAPVQQEAPAPAPEVQTPEAPVQQEAPAPAPEVQTPEAPVQQEAPAPEVQTPEAPAQQEVPAPAPEVQTPEAPVVEEHDNSVVLNVKDAVDGEEYRIEYKTPEAPVQQEAPVEQEAPAQKEVEVVEHGNKGKGNVQLEFDGNEYHVVIITPEAPAQKDNNSQNAEVKNEEPEVKVEEPEVKVEEPEAEKEETEVKYYTNDGSESSDSSEVKYYTNDGSEVPDVPAVDDSDNTVADDDFTLFHENVDNNDDDSFNLLNDDSAVEEDLSSQYEIISKQEADEARNAVNEINAQKAAKEEAIRNAFETRLGKDVSAAGGPLYYNIKRIANTDYDSDEDMVADIMKVSLAFAGDAFIKNIPFVGGFLQAYTHDVAGMQADTQRLLNQMKLMNDSIQEVTKAVNTNGAAIINELKTESEKNTMSAFDESAKKVLSNFDSWNSYCEETLALMDETTDKDELDCVALSKEFANIYTTELNSDKHRIGSTYYTDYMEFLSGLMQEGITKSTEDIFVLTDRYYLGTGVDIAKESAKRTSFANEVSSIAEYGNLMLTSCMDIEEQNLGCIRDVCLASIEELTQKKALASAEEIAEINAQIAALKTRLASCNNRLGVIRNERAEKDRLLAEVRARLEAQMKSIEDAETAFKTKLEKSAPAESVQVGNNSYTVVNDRGETLYPSFSKAGDKIEYRDIYGNLYATRTLSSSEKSYVDQYAVKEGAVYYVKERADWLENLLVGLDSYKCKVLSVWEKDNLFGWGTTRTAKFMILDGDKKGEIFEGSICAGGWRVYNIVVGELTRTDGTVVMIDEN